MSIKFKEPTVDISGWEEVLIHISNKVTSDNIKELINKDIAKMANQKQPEEDTQAKYNNKYIKALFRRMKAELDSVLAGTQEVDYYIDGANSCFYCDGGLNVAHSKVNNLTELDAFLRLAINEPQLRKLLEDLVTRSGGIGGNDVIHELKQNGVEDMIDNMRADFITKYYDEWSGDYQMDNEWWRPYTERSLKIMIIIHEVVLDYLRSYRNFDEDELWASVDSNDISFMPNFEYGNDIGDSIDTWDNLMDFIKLYAEKYE